MWCFIKCTFNRYFHLFVIYLFSKLCSRITVELQQLIYLNQCVQNMSAECVYTM